MEQNPPDTHFHSHLFVIMPAKSRFRLWPLLEFELIFVA